MFASPGSIAFTIGPLQIHWYGIIIGIGIVLAYWYSIHEVKRRGLSAKTIEDILLLVIPAGVIGARLYYVLFNLSYYSQNPIEILKIWHGGLAIHGALFGGAVAYFLYVYLKKIPLLLYIDTIVPGVLLAQAAGRFGNFFNNEAFGSPTALPWKLFIPEEFRPDGFQHYAFFHPTFLYESLWNLFGFFLLVFLNRHLYPGKHPAGIILAAYLMWYSFGRFFIEGLRLDSLYVGFLRTAQVASVILFVCGALLLACLSVKHTRT